MRPYENEIAGLEKLGELFSVHRSSIDAALKATQFVIQFLNGALNISLCRSWNVSPMRLAIEPPTNGTSSIPALKAAKT
jgi:hypothetical protein